MPLARPALVAGATLALNAGFAQSAGAVTVDGTLAMAGSLTIDAGTIGGGGAIDGNLANAGQLLVGNAVGRLTIDGALAQWASAAMAIELAGLLHPTPAVGGEPREAGVALLGELEALDRGWYTGPVGWMDAAEDGEFCVALRSGLLRDRTAHLYAGCGIVAGSEPEAELAETEIKLEALLPLVAL